MSLIEWLFWLSASLVAYGTIGYPALIWLLGRIAPKPVRKREIFPTVTCIIAARNEERTIGAKLENLLAQDYPSDRLDIIIVSDGSTDNTAGLVEEYCIWKGEVTPLTPHVLLSLEKGGGTF
ncbi:MAG: glycosyltransferase [Candidatus Methylomirabilis sp.]|nr:glycosyltransferase [Candidatus Methylomirabilis sp.]